jgi:hypothetical protein
LLLWVVGSYRIGGTDTATTLTPVVGSPFASMGNVVAALVFNEAGTFL